MKILYNEIFLAHDTGNHPESAKRLEAFGNLPQTEITSGEEFLSLVHKQNYIEIIRNTARDPGYIDADTAVSKLTFNAAVHAVGAAIQASQSGDFALVRPPGHHAHQSRASGFCIFNNIAIATQKLINQHKRIVIFDFDGHLGDGTEKFFYGSNQVLYWSIHETPAFPGGGTVDQIGAGDGAGFTINLPLAAGCGDDVYLQAVDAIMPIVKQFAPDIIGFSAGFDTYLDDPLLHLRISLDTYHEIGQRFNRLDIPNFAVLEGGYNIAALPKCVNNFIAGINGESKPFSSELTDTAIIKIEDFNQTLIQLKRNLSPFWKF